MNTPLLSVVVCTHDRSRLLRDVLADLRRQDAPAETFEIVVVDDASGPETAEVVRSFPADDPTLRYVRVEHRNLCHSRNRGFHEARGDWVAYVDDDCRLPAGWLAAALGHVRDSAPEAMGGPVLPFFDRPRPDWFRDEYATTSFGSEVRGLVAGEYLVGCNMIFERRAIKEVGGFRPELAMAGTHIHYGDDTFFQMELRSTCPGAQFLYDPALAVRHLVRRDQVSLRWLIQRAFAKGRDVYLCSQDRPSPPPRWRLAGDGLRTSVALAVDLIFGVLFRSRQRFPHAAGYYYEHSAAYLRRLGRLWAQFHRMDVAVATLKDVDSSEPS